MIRNKLIAWSITVAIHLAGMHAVVAGTVLPRENIKTFSQDATKLAKLRAAVTALKARGLADATSWFDMAAIHGILSDDPNLPRIPAPIKDLFNQCHKDWDVFFLWHRAYVAAIERLMQDAIHDPDFRLPYWDWYSDPSLPDAFRDEYLDSQHTQKNSLYMPNRNDRVNAGRPVWTPFVRTDFDNPDFRSFQRQLNGGEHGTIHGAVGGPDNMGTVEFAARDPIFFLHHAQIDRLLPVWLKIDPDRHLVPTSFRWPNDYAFPVPGRGKPWTPTVEELALGKMEAMGYTYDNFDRPKVPAPTVPARPEHLQSFPSTPVTQNSPQIQTFAAFGGNPIEVGPGGTVDLAIDRNRRQQINSLMEAAPGAAQSLSIVFEGVQVKELPPGVLNYGVFVNLPKEPLKEGFNDYYVGSLDLFELQHAAHGHGDISVKLPITPATGGTALKKALTVDEAVSSISISLIPELAPEASAPTEAVLSIKQIRIEGTAP